MNISQPKVLVMDPNPDLVHSMEKILAASGFLAYPVYLAQGVTYNYLVSVADSLRPDIIVLPEHLTETLEARMFLCVLGGKFFLEEPPLGNPRVVCTSKGVTGELVGRIGGLFELKHLMLSEDPESLENARANLVNVVVECANRLGFKVE